MTAVIEIPAATVLCEITTDGVPLPDELVADTSKSYLVPAKSPVMLQAVPERPEAYVVHAVVPVGR